MPYNPYQLILFRVFLEKSSEESVVSIAVTIGFFVYETACC